MPAYPRVLTADSHELLMESLRRMDESSPVLQEIDVDVVRLGPEDWREFRDVRLASLADSPEAFGSRYADWVDADEQHWRAARSW